jgi:hypothetical protein
MNVSCCNRLLLARRRNTGYEHCWTAVKVIGRSADNVLEELQRKQISGFIGPKSRHCCKTLLADSKGNIMTVSKWWDSNEILKHGEKAGAQAFLDAAVPNQLYAIRLSNTHNIQDSPLIGLLGNINCMNDPPQYIGLPKQYAHFTVKIPLDRTIQPRDLKAQTEGKDLKRGKEPRSNIVLIITKCEVNSEFVRHFHGLDAQLQEWKVRIHCIDN